MSVRNLVEVVVIPPLLIGMYYVLKEQYLVSKNKQHIKYLLLAGFFFGISFAIRFQSAIVPFGVGLVLLYYCQFKKFIFLSLSTIFIVSLFEFCYFG